ncbi:MAG: acylphosphatase [Miltoncostaeaceae bacterium]|jgi:acylphosphatase|nr:acylphosphatase [Miltoncostaeaceae bacterium]
MASVRARVVVHGLVQGVCFRAATRTAAARHGVSGWVRNRDDGAVEAVFEGPPEAVERMVDLCRRGPQKAWVERLERTSETPEGLAGFEIRN